MVDRGLAGANGETSEDNLLQSRLPVDGVEDGFEDVGTIEGFGDDASKLYL